jgi:hypothetical protein
MELNFRPASSLAVRSVLSCVTIPVFFCIWLLTSLILASAARSISTRGEVFRHGMAITVRKANAFVVARTGHSSCGSENSQIWLFRHRAEQTRAHGVRSGSRAGRQIELAEDAGDVAMNGVLADEEPVGDLTVGEAFSEAA